jgi:hypothetical protein
VGPQGRSGRCGEDKNLSPAWNRTATVQPVPHRYADLPTLNTSVSQHSPTGPRIVLFVTSLSGYALLNTSRTAANDFDTKEYLELNTRSACEYTLLALTELLGIWRQQQPSNQGDFDSRARTETASVPRHVIVIWVAP